MERLYKIRKGLDLNLKGMAQPKVKTLGLSEVYALMPADFHGVTPKMVVKEGDEVLVGSPIFVDKATERVKFVSPVSGKVKAVVRGERRKLLSILIDADKDLKHVSYNVDGWTQWDSEKAMELLLESGLFAFMKQRPYDVVATPNQAPKAIFISTFSKMPLAADFTFVSKGKEDFFKQGITFLSKFARVNVGISPEQINTPLLPLKDAEVSVFQGPNPSGNVGVHINHISPINKDEVVWVMSPDMVINLGKLLTTGKVDFTKVIAVAGAEVTTPQYYEVIAGAPLSDLLKGQLERTEHVRIINGNPLVGRKDSLEGYLSSVVSEVCAIPEGDDVHEMFGWIAPRLNDFSTSRSYFTWLMGSKKEYNLDCRIKGGERHMIMSGEYDKVFPMDIYAGYLIKAIIAGDIDKQEQLGIYEVAPEDFAVAEFVDSSKLELQRIVREGLDILRKENG